MRLAFISRFALLQACVLSVSLVAVSLVANTAYALEPDAPRELITPEEALVISLRQKLDTVSQKLDKLAREERQALAQFYTTGTSRPVWVTRDGLTDQARQALAEIRNANKWGLNVEDFRLPQNEDFLSGELSNRELVEVELKISTAIVRYARYARGGRFDPNRLSNDIDRKPPLIPPSTVLDTVLTSDDPAAVLRGFHPQHEQFKRLRAAYLNALDQENRPQQSEPLEAQEDRKAKKRKSRRKRRAKKRNRTKLSQRLLYNMEMWRWMPVDLGRRYVWVNIPEYKFRIFNDGEIIHQERIVTGKAKNKTPIFSDQMETVVLHPNWGVPNSIKVKELLPKLIRGNDVFSRQGLRVQQDGRDIDPFSVDWRTTDIRNYHIYQPPSSRNALGIVKFLFPNKHAVYMHDTPSKHLFKRNVRAYSHGCVRVRNPLKFAALLLGKDKGWSREKIDGLIKHGPKNNQIPLTTKVPVHITYFTAHIDDDGKAIFYRDIYGHEGRIKMGLAGQAHLIVKPKKNLGSDLNRITARTERPRRSRRRSALWMLKLWGRE